MRRAADPSLAWEQSTDADWETETTSSQATSELLSNGSPDGRHSQGRRNDEANAIMARVSAPLMITLPTDDMMFDRVLHESFNWLIGQYSTSWSALTQQDPTVFDLNDQVEIFREAFFIVSDLLRIRQIPAAFEVLAHTLDSIPQLFQNPHPELLFTLVELAFGVTMSDVPDIHAKIKAHVFDLASTFFGQKHPITTLLRTEFDDRLKTYVTGQVLKCITDTLTRTFGEDAYQTQVQQMGRSQFYARTGRINEGLQLITKIRVRWAEQYGHDSTLTRLAELESNLMSLQATHRNGSTITAEAHDTVLRISVMAEIYNSKFNKFTHRFDTSTPTKSRSHRSLVAAHWFLQNKRYSLVLHCYERAQRHAQDDQRRPLADLIADTVERALGHSIMQSDVLLDLPSRAPTADWS